METNKNETKELENSNIQLLEKNEKSENEEQKEVIVESLENAKIDEQKIIPKESKISKTKIALLTVLIVVILLAILSTIFAIINIPNNKIINGITIGKIDVSKLTQEEAIALLKEIYSSKMQSQIFLVQGEYETSVTYEALEVKFQIEKAVKEAHEIGRKGNLFKDNIDILKSWTKGQNIEMEATIDNDMIGQIAQNINNNIEGAVVEASYYIEKENAKLIITSGKEGLKVDEKQLLEDIYMVLDENTEDVQKIDVAVIQAKPDEINIEKIHEEIHKEVKDAYYTTNPFTIYPEEDGIDFNIEEAKALLEEAKEKYEITLKITKPSKTVKEIGTEAFPDLLATFSTRYQASNVNRTTNLRIAANKINGTVLLPNQEFSYNKTVGERTPEAGFKNAAVFSGGKVVDGIGGGICQISTTLYDAVIMANLNVTVRRNHQFVTSYVPAGKDATVVWGSQDFKFVNTRKNPVRITATVQGGVATVQVWGVKEEVEYDITIETKKTATITYTTEYVQNPNLPAGQQKVVQEGNNGRKVEAYKVTKLNGQVVSRTLLSKDTYNPMKKIVHVGTGN